MSSANAATVRALLARIRAEAGGSFAALVGSDRQLLAIDAAEGVLEGRAFRGIADRLAATWARAPELAQRDFTVSAAGASALAFWLAPHGVLLVELSAGRAPGLVRLGLRPLLDALLFALNGGSPGEAGEGGAARPPH